MKRKSKSSFARAIVVALTLCLFANLTTEARDAQFKTTGDKISVKGNEITIKGRDGRSRKYTAASKEILESLRRVEGMASCDVVLNRDDNMVINGIGYISKECQQP